jgi:peptidyl-tRNA hydrolase, PTH1 family
MGWLQKRVQTTEATGFYTVGQNKNVLIVGLGNVGKKYDNTRHNIGFYCIDNFVAKTDEMENWIEKKDLKTLVSTGHLGENRVIAVKPTTMMNLSGEAVQAVANFYKIPNQNIVVLHDELDLQFGYIRTRVGGGSAGHNGIKSLTEHMGENYARVRIGIGPKVPDGIDSADFVLQKFAAKEIEDLPGLSREVNAILTEYLFGSVLPHDTRSFLI